MKGEMAEDLDVDAMLEAPFKREIMLFSVSNKAP